MIASLVGFVGNQRINALEEQFRKQAASEEFLAEKLANFYVPISTHLAVTEALFARYNESGVSEEEREAIEHELLDHNSAIRERLLQGGLYLEPSESVDVELMVERLLEHYTQWETVYKLKHEYGVWTASVFAGISEFGWRGFPSEMGVDAYFRDTTRRLRNRLHELRELDSVRNPRS